MIGLRYLYYRLYTTLGAMKSNNPIYVNDPFISRTLARLITPPHTALLVKNHLLKIEGFARETPCTLFESLSNQTAIEDNSTRLSIKGQSGPGLTEDDPVALVVEVQDIENRSASEGQPNALPDANLHYLYYRIYDPDGALASRTSFDRTDDFLGRVDTRSIAPPHSVASVEAYIRSAEGIANTTIQMFENTSGGSPLNDRILPLFSQDFPGSMKDEPIAVVCEDVLLVVDPRLFKPIKVKTTFRPSDANLPLWLSITAGDTLHTDLAKMNMAYIGGIQSCSGYMAMNSAGQEGFVMDSFLESAESL